MMAAENKLLLQNYFESSARKLIRRKSNYIGFAIFPWNSDSDFFFNKELNGYGVLWVIRRAVYLSDC